MKKELRIKLEKPNLKFLDNEIPNIIEGFENNKTNIFELEKVVPLTEKYTVIIIFIMSHSWYP